MWTSNKMIALYIILGIAVIGFVAWLLLRKTLRTRLRVQKALFDDPDVNDYLVIFGWTPKVLYVPTMVASLVAAILMLFAPSEGDTFARAVGGAWFAVFLINFLVEEYDISIKILLISIVGIGFVFLWLHLLGWVGGFLRIFRHLGFSISATGYLLVMAIGLLTIGVSWFRGLFYYVALTPNYMNIQEGPTETGEQLGREEYNSRIDTGDFLERLFGFGRIVITFKERSRTPIILLVWRIQTKAQALERVRGKLAVDAPGPQVSTKPPAA